MNKCRFNSVICFSSVFWKACAMSKWMNWLRSLQQYCGTSIQQEMEKYLNVNIPPTFFIFLIYANLYLVILRDYWGDQWCLRVSLNFDKDSWSHPKENEAGPNHDVNLSRGRLHSRNVLSRWPSSMEAYIWKLDLTQEGWPTAAMKHLLHASIEWRYQAQCYKGGTTWS